MKIKPVDVASTPQYPDKYGDEIRRAIISAKPNRWRGMPLAAGLLSAAVVLGLSGCAPELTSGQTPTLSPVVPVETSGVTSEYFTMGTPVPSSILPYDSMIPLFEYGDGTGAFGCVSVAAPVFMSEEEAFVILSAAFSEAGLTLGKDAATLKNANLPVTDIYGYGNNEDRNETVKNDIIPDGMLEYDLPVVFVSTRDVQNWHKASNMMSSVSSYNVKKAAQTLAESNPNLVVFYDPIARLNYDKLFSLEQKNGESDEAFYARRKAIEQEESDAARAESERLLRLQAEAFIAWLEDGGNR